MIGADHARQTLIPSPNPAVLQFRGFDLEIMAAQQMRNIDAFRRMANLMFDSTEAITRRQAAFLKASVDQMSTAFEHEEDASDPQSIFERQAKAYQDLFGALTTHVGELAEITSNCCADMIHEATGNMVDLPFEGSRRNQAEKGEGAATRTSPAKK